jgi:hypothetical protein
MRQLLATLYVTLSLALFARVVPHLGLVVPELSPTASCHRPPLPPHGMELFSLVSCHEWATSPSGWASTKWAGQFWHVGIMALVNLPWNCLNLFKSVQTSEISYNSNKFDKISKSTLKFEFKYIL